MARRLVVGVWLLLAFATPAAAREVRRPLLLVSDVDDTVKITHVTNPAKAAVRGLLRSAVYAGMAALYREMNANLVFLSASPTALEGRLRRTLIERAGFPEARFVLRDWLRERRIADFKLTRLKAVAEDTDHPVILVGDDTERDPELFLEAAKRMGPGRVAAIYIRRNLHRPLPAGVIPFVTAFDLAVNEVDAGRLPPESAARVGEETLAAAAREDTRLFPPFYRCPAEVTIPLGAVSGNDPRLIQLRERLKRTCAELCAARKTAPEKR